MDHQSYLARCRQDPEYREVENRLKPFMDLADEVLRLRMERGWTQEELAERVGTAQANVSRLENGLANPTLEFLQKLSDAFETELRVHLQSPVHVVRAQIMPVLVSEKEYQDLFTMSAEVSAQADSIGEIVGSRVAA